MTREQMSARIRALKSKTVENGCTEAEAIAAAEMLAKLLALYNMTLDEAELRASPFERHKEHHEDEVGERLWKVADACAHLTGARYWVNGGRSGPQEINFFGFKPEVEVATYLLEICAGAMRREHGRLKRDWALVNAAKQRQKILPYLDGMADRLRERIRAMKPPPPTGKGLMVLHGQLIEAQMALVGIELQDRKARGSRDLDEAYVRGLLAADRVALNRGLSGGAGQGLLR